MIDIEVKEFWAGKKRVLSDVAVASLERSVFITGTVGSGKTLLGRAIAGDFRGSSWFSLEGSVKLGVWQSELPRKKGDATRIGYLPQAASSFFVGPSVEAEICLGSICAANSATCAERQIKHWLDTSPLAALSSLPPLALSGGQQQLLMLEAVLNTAPDHLVIDSGLVALDTEYRGRAEALLEQWLSGNEDRRLIGFGYDAAHDWAPFAAKGALKLSSDLPHRSQPVTLRERERGEEILRFSNIVGGPMVGRRHLLAGVSLALREGEFVGLEGNNGVGKSTLLRLVCGVQRPRRGEVFFRGEALGESEWKGLAGGVAYLPQEPELAGPSALGVTRKRTSGDKKDLIEQKFWKDFFDVGWSDHISDYWCISAGERAIATLIHLASYKPSVWILDEPTSRMEAFKVSTFIGALRNRMPSVSGIVVSHSDLLLEVCDRRVALTEDGIIKVETL